MAGSSAHRAATEPAARRAPGRQPGALAGNWGRLASASLELMAVLLLTLVFFGTFLVLLGAAFPVGDSLRDLALQGRRSGELASFAAGDASPTTAPVSLEVIGSLDVLRPDVRRRASETIAWDPARDGQPLYDRDAVQTGADGRALVRFGSLNELQLERNAFVVVTAPRTASTGANGEDAIVHETEPAPYGGRRRLVLMEGELLARLQAPDRTRLELSLPNVVARLADTTSRTPANFRVTVGKDRSATVAVFDGRLNLESASGVVSIGPRQFSRVSQEGEVSAPRPLPAVPAECAPASGSTYPYLDLPPRVTFAWSAVPGATQYRLRAARDPEFHEVALDETVSADTLTWGRAKPGRYWWQVAAIVDDVEGIATRTRSLVVQREELPSRLEVQAPPRLVRDPRLVLVGATDPQAHVHVMGRAVEVGRDGRFRIELELQPGANVVVVEAADAAGHTAYWSQVVHLKP